MKGLFMAKEIMKNDKENFIIYTESQIQGKFNISL